jgi:Ca2+/Na+ antiporter
LTDENILEDANRINNTIYYIVVFCLVIFIVSQNWYYLQAYNLEEGRVASDDKRMPISFDHIKNKQLRIFADTIFFPMILPLKILDYLLLGDYGIPLLFKGINGLNSKFATYHNLKHFVIIVAAVLFFCQYNILTYFYELFRNDAAQDTFGMICSAIIAIYCIFLIILFAYTQLSKEGSISTIVALIVSVIIILIYAAIQIVIALFSVKPAIALCILYIYGCSFFGILWYKNGNYQDEITKIQTELDNDFNVIFSSKTCGDGNFIHSYDKIWYYMVYGFAKGKEWLFIFYMIGFMFFTMLSELHSKTLQYFFPIVTIVVVAFMYIIYNPYFGDGINEEVVKILKPLDVNNNSIKYTDVIEKYSSLFTTKTLNELTNNSLTTFIRGTDKQPD